MQPQFLVDYEVAVARQGYVVRVLVELEGKAPEGERRVPLNLALVLDRSGSMGGEKLARAKEAAAFLARRLRPIDTLSVVAYDDEVATIAVPGDAPSRIPRRIEALDVGGCTNLSGGWLRGHELVADGRRQATAGTLHRVILLTDGLANVGITEPDRLVGLCRTAAAKGVSTSTIGFGADYDEKLLRLMADAGSGNTYYIERPDQAPGVFEEEIEGLLTVCAQNVTVDVRPDAAVQLTAIHNDYPSQATAGGVRVELGDLYAREPKSLLIELFVPGLDARTAIPIAELTLTAYALTANAGVERQEITLPILSALAPEGHAEPKVRREMMLLDAARAREEAIERQRRGDDDGAGQVLLEASAALSVAGPMYGVDLAEQAADLASLAERVADARFGEADAKYAAQRAYNARRGKAAYEEKLRRRKP